MLSVLNVYYLIFSPNVKEFTDLLNSLKIYLQVKWYYAKDWVKEMESILLFSLTK